ncbi:MAG TPA: CRTAC1 family protein [Flavitalea sp.]|nr:CRTAC1 family protein [Flavitalea sp.]
MVDLLSTINQNEFSPENFFCPEAKMEYYAASLKEAGTPEDSFVVEYAMSKTMIELGKEDSAAQLGEYLLQALPGYSFRQRLAVMRNTAMSYLRLGERVNCINNSTGESCIMPIAGGGIHRDQIGSEKAIELYQTILTNDPNDLESKWLLNIAYMTIGGYPAKVPESFLIKGLDADTSQQIKPFIDAAVHVGVNTKNMAGGSIIEDFNNDGYLDLITSSWGLEQGMHLCINNANGSFRDASEASGLSRLTGGLNIMQTDYNNDGLKDVFVLRGAWKGQFGKEPNSLLRNNGDGSFTDVTHESGLLSFHPTQTATWADFNNDGWLDVFIGNETSNDNTQESNPTELYLNNTDGTFTEIAQQAGCNVTAFVKGVTSGDYNNDGLPDLFISTLNGRKLLLKNESVGRSIHFKDVSVQSGVSLNKTRTFPTWFFDYDNDGWLDIMVCGYEFERALSHYAAMEAMGQDIGKSGKQILFRNKHDGTFEDISEEAGLTKMAFAMGANFGDIDNDGYLDFYLGTGNPQFQSLVPNKLFWNNQGKGFTDITTSARVGNLQKGHGVSFADLDNDGDQDIYLDMGGAFVGDAYQNSLYINPGQNDNHFINLSLEGSRSNRAAIGTKLKITFNDKGVKRSVYREVNSGGSFGANPLLQHIGIGQATMVESVEVTWPAGKTTQVFKDLVADVTIKIREGSIIYEKFLPVKNNFLAADKIRISCAP